MLLVKKCRICGCTDNNACTEGCYWVEDDLCSNCVDNEEKTTEACGYTTEISDKQLETQTQENITPKEKLEKEYTKEIPIPMKEYIVQKASQDLEFAQRALLPGKTLKGAYAFVKNKAKSQAVNGVAAIEDKEVFKWLEEYYTSEKTETPAAAVNAEPETPGEEFKKKEIKPSPKKKVEHNPETQISLFDFGEAE